MSKPRKGGAVKGHFVHIRLDNELYRAALDFYVKWHESHPGASFSEWVRQAIQKELGHGA